MHLYSANSFNEFKQELEKIRKKLRVSIYGFTKHGDGWLKLSRKTCMEIRAE